AASGVFVSCSYQGQPSEVFVGESATCTVTVSDTSGGSAPTGTVSWSAVPSIAGGTSSFSATTCGLGAPQSGSASCQVTFTPTSITSPTDFSFALTATYGGDATHTMASNSPPYVLTVRPASTSTQTFDVGIQSGETDVN